MQNPAIATPKEEKRRGYLSRRSFLWASTLSAASLALPTAPIKGLEWLLKQAEASTGEEGLKDYAPPGFNLGVVLNNNGEWWTLTDWDQYLGTALRDFNLIENNGFYLGIQKPTKNSTLDFRVPDEIMQFAAEHNIPIRGNVLLTHHYIPSWFEELSLQEATNEFLNFASTVVSRYKDWKCANGEKLVDSWVCSNEVFNNDWDSTSFRNEGSFWSKFANDDDARRSFLRDLYQTARAADPDAKLVLNEANIQFASWPHAQAVYELAEWLIANEAGPDIIGVQSHRSANTLKIFGNFDDFGQYIQQNNQLGLLTEVTEADVSFFTCDDSTSTDQANVFAAVLEQCLQNIGLATGWTTQGHTDKYHWIRPCGEEEPGMPCHCPTKPGSAIRGPNYEPKEAYYAIRDTLISARAAAAPAVRALVYNQHKAFLGVAPSEREAAQLTRSLQSGNLTAAELIHAFSTHPKSATHGLSPMAYVTEVYKRVLNENPLTAGGKTMRSLLTDDLTTKQDYVNNLTASHKFQEQTKGLWMNHK